MAFPQRQHGLCSEQVKFALGLNRSTITLTSVQTRFERQGKFLNFYEVYEYFREIFVFDEFSGSLRVFSKDFYFFESY